MVFGHKKHGHAQAPSASNAAARKLDAADGVMDGQYFGNPIVTHGRKAEVVPRAGAPIAAPVAAPGSLVPYHGRQAFPNYPGASYGYGAGYGYGAAPTVLPAYQTGYTAPSFGAVPVGSYAGYNSSALALDAADGVIDGKSFGRPIVQQSAGFSPYTASPIASTYAAPAPAYGTTYGAPAYSGFAAAPAFSGFSAGAASSALALDAADGVIDGKSFGRPIVQASPAVSTFGAGYGSFGAVAAPAAFPATFGAGYGATAVAAPTYTAAPAAFGAVAPAFGATAFPQTFSAAPAFSGVSSFPAYGAGFAAPATRTFGSTAAALDAADGVIDGKSFGRPIVQV